MRSTVAISRVYAARQMTWSARCSALARRSTANLEQTRAMVHPEVVEQHPVANLGPSRESIAKSRLLPTPNLQGSQTRDTKASLRLHEQDALALVGTGLMIRAWPGK